MLEPPTTPWVRELREQIARGRHVILWGNVYDHFLYNGHYLTMGEILWDYFRFSQNYSIVARYDALDGFVFPDPDMRGRFEELVRQELQVVSFPGQLAEPATPALGSNDLPTRAIPRPRPAQASGGMKLPLIEAVSQIRLALRQGHVSVAIHLDLADLLTGQADSYSEDERRILASLKKCTLEASITGQGKRLRNTLLLTSSDLQKIPLWLHRENPIVSIVSVGRPDRDDRRWFAHCYCEDFFGFEALAPENRERLLDEFADLTEGFRCWDLEALQRTSLSEQIPFERVRALIDFYKFGLKEDPWQKVDRRRVEEAAPRLTRRVLGQEAAVEAVVSMLTTAQVGISMSPGSAHGGKPKGVFFFVGPTGVGKTELAKALTELVFGEERAFARFDMSEYKEEHAAEKLAGAPPGFVGYEEGGQLTNRVMKHPHSILLFDEIEKAHPRVLDKFLQILEDGRLTDGKGQTAYFHQTAIIFTSNIGASDFSDASSGVVIRKGILSKMREGGLPYCEIQKHFREEVHWYFTSRIGRAELLNRLGDNIVVFDILRPEFVPGIAQKFLMNLAQVAKEKLELHLDFQSSVTETLQREMAQASNLMFGGRRVKSMLESLVERPLNRWLFEFGNPGSLRGKHLRVSLHSTGKLDVRLG